ncbi:MAG: NAD-dependent epimerase/dehydratase family protein [Planctomycetota bacterium]
MKADSKRTALVAGGGGFIGGHLVRSLLDRGFAKVRCVDVKPFDQWYQFHERAENVVLDLRELEACERAVDGVDEVYNLAADMGGMGFIENNKALCMLSVLINTHLLMAAKETGTSRFFYASSACVYNGSKQTDADCTALVEADAYPALAEDGYGWEKLFSERMCRHFLEDYGIETRVARFHNVYGPFGTYDGGREKAPAAMCRKVIEAKLHGTNQIEIWGDGEQTRSFMYVDDCVQGIQMLHDGHFTEPINLGSSELVSINQLVDVVEEIAGCKLDRRYDLSAPKGVRGRNSDNTLIQREYGWEPSTSLRDGMERTYAWIYDQMISGIDAALPKAGSTQEQPWLESSSSTSTTGQNSRVQAST